MFGYYVHMHCCPFYANSNNTVHGKVLLKYQLPMNPFLWLNIYELSTQTSMIIETFWSVDLHQLKLNSDIAHLNRGDVMVM